MCVRSIQPPTEVVKDIQKKLTHVWDTYEWVLQIVYK